MEVSGQPLLLILACSRRKRPDPGLLPAIDRYDGINYKIVRKAMREDRWPRGLDLLILSAKHGLLAPGDPIEDYDLLMTPERARMLSPAVVRALAERVDAAAYGELFLNLGRNYRLALEGWETFLPPRVIVSWAEGGIGQKAASMLRWLNAKAEARR